VERYGSMGIAFEYDNGNDSVLEAKRNSSSTAC